MKTYPRKEEAKIAEQLPIVAGQIAGLLNQRFMPNYHNRRIFLFTSVFYLAAPAPLHPFGNLKNGRNYVWRLSKLYTRYILASLSKSMSNEPARCLTFARLRVGWRVTLSWTATTPRNFSQECGELANESKTQSRLGSLIFSSAARGMLFPVASVTSSVALTYVSINLNNY